MGSGTSFSFRRSSLVHRCTSTTWVIRWSDRGQRSRINHRFPEGIGDYKPCDLTHNILQLHPFPLIAVDHFSHPGSIAFVLLIHQSHTISSDCFILPSKFCNKTYSIYFLYHFYISFWRQVFFTKPLTSILVHLPTLLLASSCPRVMSVAEYLNSVFGLVFSFYSRMPYL